MSLSLSVCLNLEARFDDPRSSRTFMRLSGGEIRFLVADEPTSALDPEGEYNLFSQLRELRGKKTLVFITHRFGHLTKYADLIL